MFDRDSLIKRALETGWPFVAGLMDEVRGALTAPTDGAVPRALYYASLRTLRALESLVRRMLYLMSLELDISWTAPRPRETDWNRVKRNETVCDALKQDETACNALAQPATRRIALADTLTLYFPPLEPPETLAVTYGARPSIWMLGMPRAPEPEGPHPLRTGRPPGYAKDRLRRDPLQRKLKDFWHFCHWADEAAYRPPDRADGRPAPA